MSLKFLVDILMIFSVLLAIANRLTENPMHEMIGISLFMLVLIHNLLNWRWYTTIFRGGYNIRRTLNFTVNILLLITITMIIGSSVMISRTLSPFLGIENNLVLRQIHTTAAYWFLILMAVHWGVHWTKFAAFFKKMFPIFSIARLPFVCNWLFLLAIVAYGVNASFERDIYNKLFKFYAFDFWDFNQSTIVFFLKNLSIIGVYVIVTHNVLKFLQSRQRKTRKINQNF